MLDILVHGAAAVAGVKPLDFDLLALRLEGVFVEVHLTGGTTGVVLALNDEDGRAHLSRVGDGAGKRLFFDSVLTC